VSRLCPYSINLSATFFHWSFDRQIFLKSYKPGATLTRIGLKTARKNAGGNDPEERFPGAVVTSGRVDPIRLPFNRPAPHRAGCVQSKEEATRRSLLAMTVFVAVTTPAIAADAQLEKLLVTVNKLDGKVEVEKVGRTDYLTVHLSDTKVKDADLEALKGMTQIRMLYLQNTGITDEGLANLAGLENLLSLSLNKTKITDDGLKNLAGLTKLHTLSLSNTKVTDKGLEHVKELSELKTLHLKGTKVTEDGIKDLKKTLTKVEIDH
jgi:hypothetical protein